MQDISQSEHVSEFEKVDMGVQMNIWLEVIGSLVSIT